MIFAALNLTLAINAFHETFAELVTTAGVKLPPLPVEVIKRMGFVINLFLFLNI